MTHAVEKFNAITNMLE